MTETGSAKPKWSDRWNAPGARRAQIAVATAIPVAMVNATAFIGQLAYLNQNVPLPFAGRILIALTAESIAVYVAFNAHLAQMKNDSSMRLRLGAYCVALVIGLINYSHYDAPHWRPTPLAVIMFMASVLSPVLWGIYSRRASRDELMARGLVEERAVRLGGTRWSLHPLRSFRVQYWATWHGVNDPQRAIDHFAPLYGTADTPYVPRQPRRAVPETVVRAVPAPAPEQERVHAGTVPWAESVPPAAVPAAPAQLLPGTEVNRVSSGTEVNGTPVVTASAPLEADATLSGGRPPEEVIQAARVKLADTPFEDLPSIRWVARELLGDANQRRLASRLLKDREAAEIAALQAPAPNGHASVTGKLVPGMIATPVNTLPGGGQ